jgi:hypothetical protein
MDFISIILKTSNLTDTFTATKILKVSAETILIVLPKASKENFGLELTKEALMF